MHSRERNTSIFVSFVVGQAVQSRITGSRNVMLSGCVRDTRRFEGKCRPHLQGFKAHEGDNFLRRDANHLPTDAASLLRSSESKTNLLAMFKRVIYEILVIFLFV